MTEEIKANAFRNCQGISCPMNMVYAKVELSKLFIQIMQTFLQLLLISMTENLEQTTSTRSNGQIHSLMKKQYEKLSVIRLKTL